MKPSTTPLGFVASLGLILVMFSRMLGGSEIVLAAGLLMVIGSSSGLAWSYLRGTTKEAPDASVTLGVPASEHLTVLTDAITELRATASAVREQASSNPHLALSDSEREAVVASLVGGIAKSVAGEVVSVRARHVEQTIVLVRQYFAATQARLQQEVSALTRRSNVNLIVGGVTTLIAVGLLALVVQDSPSGQITLSQLALHYLPRVSLAIFIELFSFFFLRLYRAGLADIKFFQNELTNAEAKYASVEAAVSQQDNVLVRRAVSSLARVERNFVLKKGESTVDVERLRVESETLKHASNIAITAMRGEKEK